VSTKAHPGEVWFAGLGLVAKSRPVLILAVPAPNDARALVVVAPLTSQLRNLRGEITLGPIRWLPKLSAVNIQGLASFDPSYLDRKMGRLSDDAMSKVKAALRDLLGL
jgi:mRNA interferase MazF